MRKPKLPDFPLALFYAFNQSEQDDDGVASTGWETVLEGLLAAGLAVNGTWPMRTPRWRSLSRVEFRCAAAMSEMTPLRSPERRGARPPADFARSLRGLVGADRCFCARSAYSRSLEGFGHATLSRSQSPRISAALLAQTYGARQHEFPVLDHRGLVRNQRVREAIGSVLAAAGKTERCVLSSAETMEEGTCS